MTPGPKFENLDRGLIEDVVIQVMIILNQNVTKMMDHTLWQNKSFFQQTSKLRMKMT